MSFTVEMLNSVSMENTERQAWLRVDFLGILHHVSLFLDSFKLSKQKLIGINKVGGVSSFEEDFVFFFSEMLVDGMVDG